MIGEPYTVDTIPPDLTGTEANVYTCDVFAVSGLRKRKRSEIAIAIDRQGVNIYDVCFLLFKRGLSV